MKINFYLPGIHLKIMGGYKVVYQYCNFLAEQGHDVAIYYNEFEGMNGKHLPKKIALILKKILLSRYPNWFDLNKNIKQYDVPRYNDKLVRNADISIATSYLTSHQVFNLSKEKGEKFYFIQGYENWEGITDEEVNNSYKLGMNNIVISNWLKKIVDKQTNKPAKLVLNGIDQTKFKVLNKIDNRKNDSIAMLFHHDEQKGCKYGLEALTLLKEKYPNLTVELFGSPKRPADMPEWINYTRNATEEQVVNILNKSAVFICSSLVEGFGLPGLESMCCGCALVTTNCIGIMEYANEENSLIVNTKSSKEIYEKVAMLFENKKLRIKYAKKGNTDSKKRDLITSCKEFERYITEKSKLYE